MCVHLCNLLKQNSVSLFTHFHMNNHLKSVKTKVINISLYVNVSVSFFPVVCAGYGGIAHAES